MTGLEEGLTETIHALTNLLYADGTTDNPEGFTEYQVIEQFNKDSK